ncbi:hypothetical protein [Haliangium sp.]|uniref:hypothetical protein n=1 Tax=Haliangium sp. TaxID=2663208 RepID=UPI003D101525
MKSGWFWASLTAGVLSLGIFTATVWSGTVVGSPQSRFVPAEVRSAPGGYRSFHFWHVGSGGYRGGK